MRVSSRCGAQAWKFSKKEAPPKLEFKNWQRLGDVPRSIRTYRNQANLSSVARKESEGRQIARTGGLDTSSLPDQLATLDLVRQESCARPKRVAPAYLRHCHGPSEGWAPTCPVVLQREGWDIGKRRVYSLEDLQLRMKVERCKRIALLRGTLPAPTGPNQHWSVDFVSGCLMGAAFAC